MKTLRLLSALVDYPREGLAAHAAELREALAGAEVSPARRAQLGILLERLLGQDLLASQEAWLGLFDRGRAMSLLLFEHIHGESRDRGQAMVDLVETYRKHGFEIAVRELPDYLPLVLEFLSTRPAEEIHDWLGHVSHILELLAVVHALRVFRHTCSAAGPHAPRESCRTSTSAHTTRRSRGLAPSGMSIASWLAGLTRLRSFASMWNTCRAS